MNDDDETIEIALPTRLTVLVYRSTDPAAGDRPPWISSVKLEATDVDTGQPNTFGSTWRLDHRPTRDEVLAHVVDMLSHEVRHQLGLDAGHAALRRRARDGR